MKSHILSLSIKEPTTSSSSSSVTGGESAGRYASRPGSSIEQRTSNSIDTASFELTGAWDEHRSTGYVAPTSLTSLEEAKPESEGSNNNDNNNQSGSKGWTAFLNPLWHS
jgi:hypothetical protein